MGVGGGGGGELAKVIFFLTKNPNLQKRIFVPFFEGVGRGGARLSDFFKKKKTNLKKNWGGGDAAGGCWLVDGGAGVGYFFILLFFLVGGGGARLSGFCLQIIQF